MTSRAERAARFNEISFVEAVKPELLASRNGGFIKMKRGRSYDRSLRLDWVKILDARSTSFYAEARRVPSFERLELRAITKELSGIREVKRLVIRAIRRLR